MCENIELWPAGDIEPGARGQELEAGLGQRRAAFALQQGIGYSLAYLAKKSAPTAFLAW